MVKISFWRFIEYWLIVALITFAEIWGYVKRLRGDFLSVAFTIGLYFSLLYLGSKGLLQVWQIDQISAPLEDFAQAGVIVLLLVASYIFGCLFVTPAKLYFEKKKKADSDNWDDVVFGILMPDARNLLGIGVTVQNNKLNVIRDLSVWIVGAWPNDSFPIDGGKRFGYINKYEFDKEPVFSSVDLPVDNERVFIVANYDHANRFMLRARKPNNAKPEDEMNVQKGSFNDYILDIEYRAIGVKPKLIRYNLNVKDDETGVYFGKYGVKYKKYRTSVK